MFLYIDIWIGEIGEVRQSSKEPTPQQLQDADDDNLLIFSKTAGVIKQYIGSEWVEVEWKE